MSTQRAGGGWAVKIWCDKHLQQPGVGWNGAKAITQQQKETESRKVQNHCLETSLCHVISLATGHSSNPQLLSHCKADPRTGMGREPMYPDANSLFCSLFACFSTTTKKAADHVPALQAALEKRHVQVCLDCKTSPGFQKLGHRWRCHHSFPGHSNLWWLRARPVFSQKEMWVNSFSITWQGTWWALPVPRLHRAVEEAPVTQIMTALRYGKGKSFFSKQKCFVFRQIRPGRMELWVIRSSGRCPCLWTVPPWLEQDGL